MLKLLTGLSKCHNFKCGEIYCLTEFTYDVQCCLCGIKIAFEEFLNHFRLEHLSKTDENPILDPIKEEEIDQDEIQAENLHNNEESVEIERNPISLTEPEKYSDTPPIPETFHSESSNSSHSVEEGKDVDFNGSEESDDEDSIDGKECKKDDRPFPCNKCDRSYKSKRGLWNHLRINHNPSRPKKPPKKTHQCEQCGESFRTERHLRGHMWKHTGIKCDVCGKSFSQTGNLMRHKIRHTGIKAHKCDQCDFSFFTEKELRSHMIRHTGIMPIICEICGRRCRDHGVLTAHMRRHTGERPAKCDVCGKSFFSFHDLNVHAVTHTNDRPFSCDICGSTFQRKKALRVHKKLHSTERNHRCKICGKAFTQSSGLNAHMRRHDTAISKANTNTNNVSHEVPEQLQMEAADDLVMLPDNSIKTTLAADENARNWDA